MVGKLIEARYSSRATYAESVLIARGSTARFRFRAITRVRLVVRDRNSSSQRPLGIVNSISKLCPFAKLLSFPLSLLPHHLIFLSFRADTRGELEIVTWRHSLGQNFHPRIQFVLGPRWSREPVDGT